jgi:hypothetical protein
MTNIYNKFSLLDFLAYLVPGMYFLAVIVFWFIIIFLGSTQLDQHLESLSDLPSTIQILGSTMAIGTMYLLGSFSSSFMLEFEPILQLLAAPCRKRTKEEKKLCQKIETVLESKFDIEKTCLEAGAEYIGRSIVYSQAPACAHLLARQSSVRQLRRNCVLPTLLLAGAFVFLGPQNSPFYFFTFFMLLMLFRQLIVSALSNRVSEIRETLTALVAITASNGAESTKAGKPKEQPGTEHD